LGIGKAQKDRPHYESDETHMMVGWPKTEMINVNDVREYTYEGKTYAVRESVTYPSYSVNDRDIQVTVYT